MEKKAIDKLMSLKGEIRGVALRIDADFILKERGDKGLKDLEKGLAEVGHPVKYRKIKQMDFYPLGLRFITLLFLKELFDFDEAKFVEMGKFGTKTSLVIRLFLKNFVSLRTAASQLPKIWRMYFTTGSLVVKELNEKEKYVVLQIREFPFDPIHSQYLKGYFISGIQMITGSEAECESKKISFKGDEYAEFLLRW